MDLRELMDLVIAGEEDEAKSLTEAAIAEGVPAQTVVDDGLIAAMGVVGERFGRGEIYVPEMLFAARTMQRCLDLLEPLLVGRAAVGLGTVVLGTVKGDVHDIGKNIVGIMLKGSGFTVHDLGVDVAPERFVQAVAEYDANLVGLSALLTTTMPGMRTVIEALESAGIRNRVKVIIGGAPATDEFAVSIGADGYGRDAGQAAVRAKELLA